MVVNNVLTLILIQIEEVIKSGFNLNEDNNKKDTKILMIFDTLK